ncbi:MAG: Ig-like domain-containing protein [Clostridia bacterium]|nr:Ig-like domain-containing protein [Clostridia bacterium]
MKTKLYRVLVMLLAIAMMIPSFAMAEGETFAITGTKAITQMHYTGFPIVNTDATKWSVTGMPATWPTNALIEWTVSPAADFQLWDGSKATSTFRQDLVQGSLTDQAVPGVRFTGSAKMDASADVKTMTGTITGKLIVNSKTVATDSFTVTINKVDITSIAFQDAAIQKFATVAAGAKNLSINRGTDVKITGPDSGASFSEYSVQFRIIEGGEYAKINNSGVLVIEEDAPTDAVIKVKAFIPGSTVASYDASTAVLTMKVVGKLDPVDPEKVENAYQYLGFTVNKESGNIYTTTTAENFRLMDYLTTIPYWGVSGDTLIWESSDPTIATVDENGFVTFKDQDKSASVKVTVTSKNNAKATDSCVVKYEAEKPEDLKTIKISGFVPSNTITINERNDGKALSLIDRLKYTEGKGDSLVWRNQNGIDVSGGEIDSIEARKLTAKISPVLVTVRSKYDPTQTATVTIVIKKAAEEEETYSSVSFDTDDVVEVKSDSATIESGNCVYDAYAHLNVEKDKALELQWTAKPETVATVDQNGLVTFTKVAKADDTVEISVRNTKAKEAVDDTLKLKLVVVEDEKTSYTKVDFTAQTEDTLYTRNGKFNLDPYLVLQGKGKKEDLVWTEDDPSIATVNGGIVTFKKPGTVKITMSYKKLTPATFTLNIKKIEKPYTKIELKSDSPVKVIMTKAGLIDMNKYIKVEGNELNQDKLEWMSDQQILKFDEANKYNGMATTLQTGNTKVTVHNLGEPEISLTFDVEVIEDEGKIKTLAIREGYDTLTLKTGEGDIYLDRYLKVTPADALDKNIYGDAADELIFTSDDTDILTVGKSTGKVDLDGKPGTAKITVRSKKNPEEAKVQFTITHAKGDLKSIKFVDVPKTLSRSKGGLNLFDYLTTDPWYYTDKDYADDDLYWDSSDPQIATAENGFVTWKGVGKVTITVTEVNSKLSDKVEIEMTDPSAVQEVILKDITLEAGDNVKLTDFMTINPLDADWKAVKFTSSDRNVAEILYDEENSMLEEDREGFQMYYLGAYRGGESTITVYVENYDKSVKTATCKVTVIGNNDVEDVKIAKNKYALKLNTKRSVVVRFNAEPYNCDIDADDIYVVSSDSAIADTYGITVDSEGRKGHFTVYAKKPGRVWFTIKRTKDDKELDACKIVISAVRVKSVKWKKDTVKMYWYDDGIADSVDLKINKVYRNVVNVQPVINPVTAYYDIAFETSDPGVAFINPDSKVAFMNGESSTVQLVAVGPGTCKITMKVNDGKKIRKASMTVEVETKRPKLKISQRTATLKLEKGKDTLQLRAYDANTDTDMEVKWASSDTSVAKVNVDGKVRAVGAGKATITATTKNGQKQVVKCKITVKAPSTENVAAKKITGDTKVTVKAGEKKALEIKVKPEGAKVTFTSSDSKIVKVTKDGTIKGIKAGKATITVKAAEGKAELKIKVVVK